MSAPTAIHPSAVVDPGAMLGEGVRIGPFAYVGPEVEIGDGTVIGPHCTITGPTRIGSDNMLLAYTHVAHDCIVGNHCVFSNNSTLAGHVTIEDWVIMSGFAGAKDEAGSRAGNGEWRVGNEGFMRRNHVLHTRIPLSLFPVPAVVHRCNGRSPRSMKCSSALTSALASACSASCCLASASGSPATYSVR